MRRESRRTWAAALLTGGLCVMAAGAADAPPAAVTAAAVTAGASTVEKPTAAEAAAVERDPAVVGAKAAYGQALVAHGGDDPQAVMDARSAYDAARQEALLRVRRPPYQYVVPPVSAEEAADPLRRIPAVHVFQQYELLRQTGADQVAMAKGRYDADRRAVSAGDRSAPAVAAATLAAKADDAARQAAVDPDRHADLFASAVAMYADADRQLAAVASYDPPPRQQPPPPPIRADVVPPVPVAQLEVLTLLARGPYLLLITATDANGQPLRQTAVVQANGGAFYVTPALAYQLRQGRPLAVSVHRYLPNLGRYETAAFRKTSITGPWRPGDALIIKQTDVTADAPDGRWTAKLGE